MVLTTPIYTRPIIFLVGFLSIYTPIIISYHSFIFFKYQGNLHSTSDSLTVTMHFKEGMYTIILSNSVIGLSKGLVLSQVIP